MKRLGAAVVVWVVSSGCSSAPASATSPILDGTYEAKTNSWTARVRFLSDAEEYTLSLEPCSAGATCTDGGRFTFDPDSRALELDSAAGGRVEVALDRLETSLGGAVRPLEDLVEKSGTTLLVDRTRVLAFSTACQPQSVSVLVSAGTGVIVTQQAMTSCGPPYARTTASPDN